MTRHALQKQRFTGVPLMLFVLGIASSFILGSSLDQSGGLHFFDSGPALLDLQASSEVDLSEAQFGYSQFRVNGNTSKLIDARFASWIVSNNGGQLNTYPFLIDHSVPDLDILGGTVLGTVPQDLDWLDIYNNSAAVMVRDAPRAAIYDWTITKAWDGIRIAAGSDGFRIENVAISAVRDDAVENDFGASGTITNSLFDGVFSGISMTHNALPDVRQNVVTLDHVLLRMQSFPFKGRTTHQSPFKIETNSPSIKIRSSVIAIDDVDHVGVERLRLAWTKTVEASGNFFLNLSDRQLPAKYPIPGEGWTVLQGQTARDHWATVKEDWVRANPSPAGNRVRYQMMLLGPNSQEGE